MIYNKLVRDKIPEIIKNKGRNPKTHTANDAEYWFKLKDKLNLDAEDYMRIRLSGTLELAKDDPAFMNVIVDFLSMAMSNPVHRRGIRRFFKKYRRLSSVGLKPGFENGIYRNVKPEIFGAIIMAVIFGLGIQWVIDKDSFNFDEVTKIAEDMVMLYLKKED